MDSLINEMGGDSLGLNIVYETAPVVAKPTKTRKQKNNKYEKRRAKAKRAKGETVENSAADDNVTVAANNDTNTDTNPNTGTTVEQKEMMAPMQDVSDSVAQAMQGDQAIDISSEDQYDQHEHETPGPAMKAPEEKAPENNTSSNTDSRKEKTEMSRKTSHEVTTKALKDEVKHAQYLSTYHARPYEMDRKSGAVSRIQESKDSMHIFGGDAEDDDEDMTGDDSKSKCPFTQCDIHERIVKAIRSDKFKLKRPTIIQRNAWEQIIDKGSAPAGKRKNLFIQSETGSGKTLAFLIPLLQSLAIDPRSKKVKKVDRNLGGTRAIILCPTRELATQTYTVAEKLCLNSFPWLVAGCLSGGEKRKSEKARLRKGVSILISTPGRLLDHLEKTDCLLMALKGKVEWIVLDESDRLLDMGLGSQVEQIVHIVRSNQPGSGFKRDGITWQSVLVSATISKQVEKLASKLMGGDKWVWARASKNKSDEELVDENQSGSGDANSNGNGNGNAVESLQHSAPHQLTQLHMVVSSKLRLSALVAFLAARVEKKERVVVFMSTCDGVDYHYKLFQEMNSILSGGDKDTEDADSESTQRLFGKECSFHRLHGNIPHRERYNIITTFSEINKSQASVLITTDVTARGLNLPAVDWIVQYDPPCETADYVHRAGRAARAGKSGHALLFLLPSETQYVEVLKLRGLNDIAALSLASTLQNAAKFCPEVTSEGLHQTGQGKKASDGRIGEAFASAVQIRMEDALVDDDKSYKESLSKKVQKNKEASDKTQRKKERREAKNAIGPLLESARAAYNAYIRGYSTKEKAVRHIFSARALHLGHVARSFALKEQPKELSKAQRNARREEVDVLKSTGRKRNNALAFGKKGKKTGSNGEEEPQENLAALPKKGNNGKKQRNVSFDEYGDDPDSFSPKISASNTNTRNKSVASQETAAEKPFYKNAKAKMLAAANNMQSGMNEYF
jgi:ATP-dependent RNA helicase DDX31/DBP7